MNDATSPSNRAAVPPLPLPVLTLELTLKTEFAARVYRRCFDRLKGDLYVLTVRTRAAGMMEAARAAEEVIEQAFSSVRIDLDADIERSDALLDDVKLTSLADYERVASTKATYSTPQAREFLDLLLKMDQLLMRYDVLWLSQHIDTQQRWSRCHNWQRRLTKTANRIRELGNRMRAALTREGERHSMSVASTAIVTAGADTSMAQAPAEAQEQADDVEHGVSMEDEARHSEAPAEACDASQQADESCSLEKGAMSDGVAA